MPELTLRGCVSRPLASYLKGLGIWRLVAEQADSAARARWSGLELQLQSRLDESELAQFVVESYRPTPIISPWNGGSGFYRGGNPTAPRALDALEQLPADRLAAYREAIAVGRQAVEDLGLKTKPTKEDQKAALIRRLRAWLPDRALDWLDAAIVLDEDSVTLLPVLGTGGNIGNFDFSTNHHQALLSVLPEADVDVDHSTELLRAALFAEPAELPRGTNLSHLHTDSSPVSDALGGQISIGNPWDLVLALEGSVLFAAGRARRQAGLDAKVVAPFVARPTAAGQASLTPDEKAKAELWAPLWAGWSTLPEFVACAREARVQVGRRGALTGLDFLRAAGSFGTARGIDEFERYIVAERYGQADLAVPVGRVRATGRSSAAALGAIDGWHRRLGSRRGSVGRGAAVAIHALDVAMFAFADSANPEDGCRVLEALGEVETALALIGKSAELDRIGVRPPYGLSFRSWIEAADDGSPEFAAAVTVACGHDESTGVSGESPGRLPAIRDYLHGTTVDRDGRRSYEGTNARRVSRRASGVQQLAELHVRRHLDARRLAVGSRQSREPSVLGYPCNSFPASLHVARLVAAGVLDLDRVVRLVAGVCLFDADVSSRGTGAPSLAPAAYNDPSVALADPTFEVLALAWHPPPRDAAHDARQLGPRPGWAARVSRGDVSTVVADALLRLHMAGLRPLLEPADLSVPAARGPLLSAALLLPLQRSDRTALARRYVVTETADEPQSEGALL
ncbi:MAG: type I-G CRISPR-associated protein Cas8g1/Csx17 [Solirubrobacterales bacterium]